MPLLTNDIFPPLPLLLLPPPGRCKDLQLAYSEGFLLNLNKIILGFSSPSVLILLMRPNSKEGPHLSANTCDSSGIS